MDRVANHPTWPILSVFSSWNKGWPKRKVVFALLAKYAEKGNHGGLDLIPDFKPVGLDSRPWAPQNLFKSRRT